MGILIGMRVAMLLEVDLRLEGQLEQQLELNPRKPREIRPDPPNPDFWSKTAFPIVKGLQTPPWEALLEPLSKSEKRDFAPGDAAYNYPFSDPFLVNCLLL